jgi:transposase
MAKKRKYGQHREQMKIAGTERLDRIPEIDKLGDQWLELDEQIEALKEDKDETADELVAKLTESGRDRYVFEDRYGQLQELTIAELTVKVKVRKLVRPRRKDDDKADGNN